MSIDRYITAKTEQPPQDAEFFKAIRDGTYMLYDSFPELSSDKAKLSAMKQLFGIDKEWEDIDYNRLYEVMLGNNEFCEKKGYFSLDINFATKKSKTFSNDEIVQLYDKTCCGPKHKQWTSFIKSASALFRAGTALGYREKIMEEEEYLINFLINRDNINLYNQASPHAQPFYTGTINESYVELTHRTKEDYSVAIKGVLKGLSNVTEYTKDLYGIKIKTKKRNLKDVFISILYAFTESPDWKDEKIREIKTKNLLTEDEAKKMQQQLSSYLGTEVTIKKSTNENSDDGYSSLSVVLELLFPEKLEQSNIRTEKKRDRKKALLLQIFNLLMFKDAKTDDNNESKLSKNFIFQYFQFLNKPHQPQKTPKKKKRSIEIQFTNLGFTEKGFAKHTYYKLKQALAFNAYINGPILSEKMIDDVIKRFMEKIANEENKRREKNKEEEQKEKQKKNKSKEKEGGTKENNKEEEEEQGEIARDGYNADIIKAEMLETLFVEYEPQPSKDYSVIKSKPKRNFILKKEAKRILELRARHR